MVTEYCKCGGAAGYRLIDGDLICQGCGGKSSTSAMVGEHFVRIGDKKIVCPTCGTVIQEDREGKVAEAPENKIADAPENKRIVPRGVRKLGR